MYEKTLFFICDQFRPKILRNQERDGFLFKNIVFFFFENKNPLYLGLDLKVLFHFVMDF